jgi:hypothetical protein
MGEFLFRASVSYMLCTDTLDGFYYVGVLGWYTRCKTAQECTALFDLLELNKERLMATYTKRKVYIKTINYLSDRIKHEQDPIYLAAMTRKIKNMEQDVSESMYIVV